MYNLITKNIMAKVANFGNIKDFALNASQARSLAEMYWGKHGTHAYRTNRKGAYYYSCSGHGGYIVNQNALTKEEIERLTDFGHKPEQVDVYEQDGTVIFVNLSKFSQSNRTRRNINYDRSKGWPNKEYHSFYFFEEDCAWAVLEFLTDVKLKDANRTKEDAEKTLKQWYGEEFEAYQKLTASTQLA
jgi:hypothetical protein